MVCTISLSAQSRKGKKKQRPAKTETRESTSTTTTSSRSKAVSGGTSENPRADRKIAITGESGFKTLSGFGLNGTYYIQPKIAVDLGAGLGVQLAKIGVRGRYLFLDKKFSPYVGVGAFLNATEIKDVASLDSNGFEYFIDLNRSLFGQFVVGAEFMATKGFVVGFNVGYAAALTEDSWTTNTPISPETETITEFIFGSSPSIAFNIGYAF